MTLTSLGPMAGSRGQHELRRLCLAPGRVLIIRSKLGCAPRQSMYSCSALSADHLVAARRLDSQPRRPAVTSRGGGTDAGNSVGSEAPLSDKAGRTRLD